MVFGACPRAFGIWPPPGPRLLAATAAATSKMNVVVLNLKLVSFDIRPTDAVEERILDINNSPAIQADQMVMLVELRIEPSCRTRMAGPGYQAERDECAQDAMDRHTRDLWQLGPDRAVKLLSRGMVGAVLDRFKDGAPLGSDRQPAFAVGGEEAVYSLLFFCQTHHSKMNLYTR